MDARKLPKVVICMPTGLSSGGVTTWSIGLAQRLHQSGGDVEILCHSSQASDSFHEPPSVNLRSVPGANAIRATSRDVAEYLAVYQSCVEGPSVFVPNYSWGAYAASALLAICDPINARILSVCHADEEWYYRILVHYEPIISRFIGVSREVSEKLVSLMPHRARDIRTLVYPVPVASAARPIDRSPSRRLVITFAGRMQIPQKRITDVEPLCLRLSQTNGCYHFQFAGDGPERRRLEAFFADRGFARISATFLGLVAAEQMPRVWRSSDIAILFSEFEGTSIAMLEAMGQGVCPLVTDVSGVRDLVRDGANGFVCKVGDIEAMASVLQDLYKHPDRLNEISRQSLQTILSTGSFDVYDENWRALIQECVDEPPHIWPEGKPVIPDHADIRHYDNPPVRPLHSYGYSELMEALLGKLGSRLRSLRA